MIEDLLVTLKKSSLIFLNDSSCYIPPLVLLFHYYTITNTHYIILQFYDNYMTKVVTNFFIPPIETQQHFFIIFLDFLLFIFYIDQI